MITCPASGCDYRDRRDLDHDVVTPARDLLDHLRGDHGLSDRDARDEVTAAVGTDDWQV